MLNLILDTAKNDNRIRAVIKRLKGEPKCA